MSAPSPPLSADCQSLEPSDSEEPPGWIPGSRSMVALWGAAALSGAAALVYEVCWTRALVVPLGNSADATALVLAGFMLGMAAGAVLGGRVADATRFPLRWYALAEAALAVYALGLGLVLPLLQAIPATLAGSDWLGVTLRRSAALVLVGVACLPMGAAMPFLVRVLTAARWPLGARVSIAYAVNTAGAAAGACWSGFWGIANFGVAQCAWVGVFASLLASQMAWAAGLGAGPCQVAGASELLGEAVKPERSESELVAEQRRRWYALGAAGLAGYSMLAAEILWARLLTFVFGHDTYAFASLLVMVLAGLALGGLIHQRLRRLDQLRVLSGLFAIQSLTLVGCFWVAAAWVVSRGRDPFHLEARASAGASVWIELYRELAFTPWLVLLPSICAGTVFPAACSLYAGRSARAGRGFGRVAWVNGIGATLGALSAEFGMVGWAGIQRSFVGLGVLLAAGSSVLWMGRGAQSVRYRWLSVAPMAATVALCLALPAELPRHMLWRVLGNQHQELVHYEEGKTGTVSVIHNSINGEKQLVMNAVNEVTTRLVHDQSFKLLGHLAPLLHPQPKLGVMICLGAGLSAGAALQHPLERLDVVDLSSSVARGARHFAEENNHVLDHPRFRFHLADGRQYLLNTQERYDVAMVDSTHPKAVDSWILYTEEFYRLLRARLTDGGIAVQWLPLHGLSEREFKIIVRTFQSVFPEMTLWANTGFETYGQVAYAKLVGVRGGALRIDVDTLARRLAEPAIQRDLAPFGMDTVDEILDLFLAAPEDIRQWTAGLPVQTDNHPFIPYTSAYTRGRRMEPPLLVGVRSALATLLTTPPPNGSEESRLRLRDLELAHDVQGFVQAGRLDRALELRPKGKKTRLFQQQTTTTRDYYSALAERYPSDPDRLFEAATQLGTLGHSEPARAVFQRALSLWPEDARLRLNSALLELALGRPQVARTVLSSLVQEAPHSALARYDLGAAWLAEGDLKQAVAEFNLALAEDPALVGAALELGRAHLNLGNVDLAEAVLKRLAQREPWVPDAADLLGLAAARRGDHEQAVDYHRRAVRLDPYRATAHYNLGVALDALGRVTEAKATYRQALHVDPSHVESLNNLALILLGQAQPEPAAELLEQAVGIRPTFAEATFNLGLAWRAQGRLEEARTAACAALQLNPVLKLRPGRWESLGIDPASCAKRETLPALH